MPEAQLLQLWEHVASPRKAGWRQMLLKAHGRANKQRQRKRWGRKRTGKKQLMTFWTKQQQPQVGSRKVIFERLAVVRAAFDTGEWVFVSLCDAARLLVLPAVMRTPQQASQESQPSF